MITVILLIPAGIAGALIGDRIGLWIKERLFNEN